MKTTKLLTAVSAAALLGISSFALAQGTGGAAGSSTGGGAGATGAAPPSTQAPSGAGGASTQNSGSGSGSMSGDRAQSKDGVQSKDGMKNQAQQGMGKDSMGKDAQKSNQAQTPSDSKSQMSQDKDGAKDGAKSGSTVGAASSGAVNLTTEQRTTIRKEVLTTNAPRATNINFSVNVGTVVPSTVRVVEVPATIIKIHPQWKGYRYFVYNDEIIIVEPRTLKIIAVLQV